MAYRPAFGVDGSPPLARGAPPVRVAQGHPPGITPARAGSTTSTPSSARSSGDHPRSRGEHQDTARANVAVLGSPPLARGAQLGGALHVPAAGITPARAGSTPPLPGKVNLGGDHPRSRGEHRAEWGARQINGGSPPLARGALRYRIGGPVTERITPARAGSTPARTSPRSRPADHPRSRGEHSTTRDTTGAVLGSPPLARGAQDVGIELVAGGGITPARAGSTGRGDRTGRGWRDHPRSRGEHFTFYPPEGGRYGSPPLARGARAAVNSSWRP